MTSGPGKAAPPDVPSVLDLIKSRRDGASDPYTLALSVEGGGMRGVVSASLLMGLRDLGVDKVFDRFYGTSSGSLNIAYFAGGGYWPEVALYYDHLPQGFVRKLYRYPHKPLLDMAFAFEEIMVNRRPINVEQLVRSSYDVRIVLADVDDLKPRIVALREVPDEINRYLEAGSWLPLLSGPPFLLHGRRYLDGGVLWPDPVYAAIADNCTHVLCVNTAAGDIGSEHSKRARFALQRVLNGWANGLGDAYFESRRRWDRDKAALPLGQSASLDGVSVTRIAPPPGSHKVKRLTMDRGELLDGVRAGYSTAMHYFGGPKGYACFAVFISSKE